MNVLGVNYYQHHAAAALVVKGNLVAAAEEERFTRIKHDGQIPTQAIAYCLKEGGLELSDIDLIAVSVDFLRLFREKYLRYTLNNFPDVNTLFLQNTQNIQKLLTAEEQLRSRLNYSGRVEFYKHHLCHAASSYYLSGLKEAAVVSVDGLGEIETTIIAHAREKEINVIRKQNFPHSLGLLYEAICAYLGYRFGSEGTVMALASFGNSNAIVRQDRTYQDIFNDMVKLKKDALFEIDLSYFNYPHTKNGWVSSKFIDIFGPHKPYEAPVTQHHKNIAAGLQNCFEKTYLHIIRQALTETGSKNLCLAGGCALNCVANGKIIKTTDTKDFYIQPAANDAGASIGAALYASAKYDNQMQPSKRKDTTYWGPQYDGDYIRHLLDQQGMEYTVLEDPSYEGAKLLSQSKVIGWFQGRMEFGPRALGNRSILAPPNSIAIKNRINSTIKHREMFRPFAPSVLKEHVQYYFQTESESPFMLEACKVLEEHKENLCGIIHIDDTARIQVVTPERNRRYYDLICHYFQFSGIPVVLNTSFNDKGEPIVCTPENALDDFRKLSLDALIMDNYLLLKNHR